MSVDLTLAEVRAFCRRVVTLAPDAHCQVVIGSRGVDDDEVIVKTELRGFEYLPFAARPGFIHTAASYWLQSTEYPTTIAGTLAYQRAARATASVR